MCALEGSSQARAHLGGADEADVRMREARVTCCSCRCRKCLVDELSASSGVVRLSICCRNTKRETRKELFSPSCVDMNKSCGWTGARRGTLTKQSGRKSTLSLLQETTLAGIIRPETTTSAQATLAAALSSHSFHCEIIQMAAPGHAPLTDNSIIAQLYKRTTPDSSPLIATGAPFSI